MPGRLDDRVSRALAALEDDRNLADCEAPFRADRQRDEVRRADAERLIAEIERFLRSGGWICVLRVKRRPLAARRVSPRRGADRRLPQALEELLVLPH